VPSMLFREEVLRRCEPSSSRRTPFSKENLLLVSDRTTWLLLIPGVPLGDPKEALSFFFPRISLLHRSMLLRFLRVPLIVSKASFPSLKVRLESLSWSSTVNHKNFSLMMTVSFESPRPPRVALHTREFNSCIFGAGLRDIRDIAGLILL